MKDYLSSHSMHSQEPISKWHRELISNGDNQEPKSRKYASDIREYLPRMLFCFDEARWLTDSHDSLLLHSLQQALQERFQSSCIGFEDSLPNGNFFAVFLDTSLRIFDFSPPTHLDNSSAINFLTSSWWALSPSTRRGWTRSRQRRTSRPPDLVEVVEG